MGNIFRMVGHIVLTMLKWALKFLLGLIWLALEALKVILMLCLLVLRLFFSFLRMGTV